MAKRTGERQMNKKEALKLQEEHYFSCKDKYCNLCDKIEFAISGDNLKSEKGDVQ